ncbi:MAG: peptidylprolyl isomerase [Candidatus Kapabacteria bacterium]|nr:peptidylprolyl isomerase [Candidatus Kapabacteria bacterium]
MAAVLFCDSAYSQSQSNTNPRYVITISQGGAKLGDIEIELMPAVAPKHCANFDSLVRVKFYDGSVFHRVIPGFMIQGGSLNSKIKPRERNMWGASDTSQKRVPAEFSDTKHKRGVISAARTNDPNSATSQFFICVDDATHLDGKYSAFGQVVRGMDVVDAIVDLPRDERDNPIERVEMIVVRIN